MAEQHKSAYICGPLTEVHTSLWRAIVECFWEVTEAIREGRRPLLRKIDRIKRFYAQIADVCEVALGVRAFVPHEHYDPVLHAKFTPDDVDAAERRLVTMRTSVLIVVALAPSWGGGIEVEMARNADVPTILVCDRRKLAARKISRLLRGNPSIVDTIAYETEQEALDELRKALPEIVLESSHLRPV